jgi:lysophospholipase L1-like esterase
MATSSTSALAFSRRRRRPSALRSPLTWRWGALLLSLACTRGPAADTPADAASARAADGLAASDPHVAVMGRVVVDDGALRFGYPGVTLRVAFEGASLSMRASSTTGKSRLAVLVDDAPPVTVRLPQQENEVTLVEGLGDGPHHVDIVHRTETWQGIVRVSGFRLGAEGRWLAPRAWPERRLMFIGDSVTSGEGAGRGTECSDDAAVGADAYSSYGMRLARALEAQVHLVSYGGRGLLRDWQGKADVLNAPQFFQLSIAEESPKVLWNHASYRPDLVVVSLGTNDFNRELGPAPKRADWLTAELAFVRSLRALYPNARIILTEGAMLGDDDPKRRDRSTLRSYLEDVARQLGDDGVRFVPSTQYPGDACNAHPTGEQHAAMAADLEPAAREMLGW